MAAYPSHAILIDSEQEPEQIGPVDLAQTGTQHGRTFHSQQYYRFTLLHQLSYAEFESLRSTYTTAPGTALTLTYDLVSPQETYSVKFLGPPVRTVNLGNDRFIVEVPLRGFRD